MNKYFIFILILFMSSCNVQNEKKVKPYYNPNCGHILSECEENDKEKDSDPRFLFLANIDTNSFTGIYIPKNLDECFIELDKMLHPEAKTYLSGNLNELTDKDICKYQMTFGSTFGLFLRNKWGLWGESRLAKYFNGLGISHPDSMFVIIRRSYLRYLKNEPIRLEEQIKESQRLKEITKYPEACVDQETGGKLRIISHGFYKDRYIYAAINEKTEEIWFYEYDKGWYKPDKEMLNKFPID